MERQSLLIKLPNFHPSPKIKALTPDIDQDPNQDIYPDDLFRCLNLVEIIPLGFFSDHSNNSYLHRLDFTNILIINSDGKDLQFEIYFFSLDY